MLENNLNYIDLFIINSNATAEDKRTYIGKKAILLTDMNETYKFGNVVQIRNFFEVDRHSYVNSPAFEVSVSFLKDRGTRDKNDYLQIDANKLFILPSTEEELKAEYDKLLTAAAEIEERIAWANVKDGKFDEIEYQTDRLLNLLDSVEKSEKSTTKIKKILGKYLKIL